MKGQTLTPSRTLYPGFTLSTGSATAPYSEHMEMNNETKHTPEPWTFSIGDSHLYLRGDNGNIVARSLELSDNGAQKANFRRIVACVNACAGLPTATLEAPEPWEAVICHVSAQRDELAAALRKVRDLEPISVDEITALLAKVQL